jgi:CubicO group peptidase (beta-lactamase class C family)
LIAPTPAIEGHCDARFAPLRETFAANFRELDEVGAGLCVEIGGVRVVDLWGGHRDAERTRPWREDTLVNAFSIGKGVVAMLALALIERGDLALDAPVARYWPEFGAAGKQALTVRTLLAHGAGLPAVRERMPDEALYDWNRICAALASQKPYWEPGTAHGYHVNTYGFLVGELIRRTTQIGVGEALARILTGPAGADYHWGLAPRDHARVAEVVRMPAAIWTEESRWPIAFPPTGDDEHDRMVWHAYFNPSGISGMGTVNTPEWRSAVIPSTNGHATARSVATLYAAFVRGGPPGVAWVGDSLRREAVTIHADGEDRVTRRASRFGLGFQLAAPSRPIGASPRAFGHFGFGGSLGFADPDADLAFGYVTNRPGERWHNPRTERLIDALYRCLQG